MSLSSFWTFAHEVNKAYFIIYEKENKVELQAEFPWTLREALIEFEPKLREAKSSSEFKTVFQRYIHKNLVLTDNFNRNLPFIDFKELPNNGHGHGNSYLFVFEGNKISKIENRIMFNIYDNQENIHFFEEDKKQEHITSLDNPVLKIGFIFNLGYLVFILILIGFFIFILKKYIFSSKQKTIQENN